MNKEENSYLKAAEDSITQGNFDDAIVKLEKSIILNPKEAKAYLKLGLIYEKIRLDTQKAKKYYLEFLKVETDETLKNEVQKWLNSLGGVQEPSISEEISESGGILRLVLDRNRNEHENEIERLKEEYQQEINTLKKELEMGRKKASGESADNSINTNVAEQPVEDPINVEDETETKGDASLEALKKQIVNLKSELAVARENDSNHIEQYANAVKVLEEERTKYAQLEASLFELEKNYRTALARVNELTGEKVTDDKLPTAENELADARKKIGELQQQIIKLKNDAAILETDVQRLNTENRKLKAEKTVIKTVNTEGKSGSSHTISSKTKTDVPGIKEIAGNNIHYSVQPGDTLSRIAEKFYGDKRKWNYIFNANRDLLKDQNDIKIGDTIKVPIIK